MDSYNVGDGYIYINETQECRYHVAFDNVLAPADMVTGIEHGTLQVLISRGRGADPDDVMIYDNLTGVSYRMTVTDNTVGRTCIPWPLLG